MGTMGIKIPLSIVIVLIVMSAAAAFLFMQEVGYELSGINVAVDCTLCK